MSKIKAFEILSSCSWTKMARPAEFSLVAVHIYITLDHD